MIDLNNNNVLITGACGALGSATAQVFAQANAKLALVDISQDGLEDLSNKLTDTEHSIHTCDLTDGNEVEQLIKNIVKDCLLYTSDAADD